MNTISKKARLIFFIAIFALMIFVLFSILTHQRHTAPDRVYRFDFEQPLTDEEKEFWLISRWGEFRPESTSISVKDGALHLIGDMPTPFLMSKPIDITPRNVITVERRVRLTKGRGAFSGGFALYQTEDMGLIPAEADGEWSRRLGDGIVLVEYSHDLLYKSTRPGRDVFRFLASDWEYNRNFELIQPIYDRWVVERLVFDMRTNQMTYRIEDHEYRLNSYSIDKSAFRVLMHSFATEPGSKIEIDYIEIKVEDKGQRR